jgi:PST family polysaccharide transporter
MWVAGQAALTRVIVLVQQLALAYLLAKSDFGLIGLAYTVTTIVALMANPGIDAVLVQRMRHFKLWATPALWLGMAMGLAGTVAMLALAPIAAWAYGEPKLIGLIAVLAFALPFQALQIVPKSLLRTQMRFGAVVMLALLNTLVAAVLTIGMAWLGMGAYSLVVPVPIAAAVTALATWQMARPTIRRRVEFTRWKYLFGNSMVVGATELLHVFINQADYMALGLAGLADETIGAYVFAYSIAIQPLRVISGNILIVLFPGLSHLSGTPEKQTNAALRAMRLSMLVTVPVCLLQVLLTEPLLHLFNLLPKWDDAILPCQLLTIGLMINAASWPANSLLLAQGRFRERMWLAVGGTIAFVIVLTATILAQPTIVAVAVVVMVYHAVYSPVFHWWTMRGRAPRGSFVREAGPPLAAGLAGFIPALLLTQSIPHTRWGDVISIVAAGGLLTAIYATVLFFLVPKSVHDFWQQVAPLWHRVWPRRVSAG